VKRSKNTGGSEAAQYAIGIDLGTTNSVVAFVDLTREVHQIELLPLPQLIAPGTIEKRPILPSFLYLASDAESGSGSFDMAWAKKRDYAVGEFARKQAVEAPTRVVGSAKSWLAHSRVDRHQAILPWGAPPEVKKVSPVEASRRYLEHVISSWNAAFPESVFADQQITLTVPASFDAGARDLTREAALEAGFPDEFVLLEEPQAALYAWLADRGDRWRKELKVGETLLVCDIGGGTTDFTLIRVVDEEGVLGLQRVAVGNHLLVGGDNMDLALAHLATGAFALKGVQVDAWQSVALWHACRAAKETLLQAEGPKKHPVAVLGRGSRLIGGTISTELDRSEVLSALVDGFFPHCRLEDKAAVRHASGFREIGLPYETDTAITRHLAQFLNAHGQGKQPVRPTHVLFNGGVLKAEALRRRLLEVLKEWFPKGEPPQVLEGNLDLDFAVARGAAYYGSVKRGQGVRIRGGTARSYYIGIETTGLAIPGATRPLRYLCVVPFGMEEGTEAKVPSQEIGLVVGEPAQFRFFSSVVRKQDKPGDILERATDDEIVETDSLQTTLPKAKGVEEDFVPVRFESRITELGVLELWCASAVSKDRWKLEFKVREDAGAV
jgi:molecular chaperone DnaK (HSP70)